MESVIRRCSVYVGLKNKNSTTSWERAPKTSKKTFLSQCLRQIEIRTGTGSHGQNIWVTKMWFGWGWCYPAIPPEPMVRHWYKVVKLEPYGVSPLGFKYQLPHPVALRPDLVTTLCLHLLICEMNFAEIRLVNYRKCLAPGI